MCIWASWQEPQGELWDTMSLSGPDDPVEVELKRKFRAEAKRLAATFEARRHGGKHRGEQGLRNEQVLIDYLREQLPPKYGVGRGEVVDSQGGVARQCDVVIYDALHAPMLQGRGPSRVFPAECVYAVIELKPLLNTETLGKAIEVVHSAKRLDRSATVPYHEGHRCYGAGAVNPPMFGAIFAVKRANLDRVVVPQLVEDCVSNPPTGRVDCVCVLDQALFYYFEPDPHGTELDAWNPTILGDEADLGYYESGEDTLMLFTLFLLYQLHARSLFPPDLLRYARPRGVGRLRVRVPWLPRLEPAASKG